MERQQSLRAPPSLRGDSLSREAMALDSQRSLANGSLAWPWSNSSMDKSTHAKAEKFVRPVAKHHFGLLDVPQPETFFASSQLPGSWRGHSHAPLSIPEATDLASPLEPSGTSQQLIRPKPVSRKAHGEASSRSQHNHHKPVMRSRSGVGASTVEGSATSDDHENSHSRLIPKRGQGPNLRSEGGGKIDEYLMRLLHTGGPPSEPSKNSDGNTPRNVSRLGPLAGAGVMASSIQHPSNGNGKAAACLAAPQQEPTDHCTEPPSSEPKSGLTRPSNKTQPSIAGVKEESREKASLGSLTMHPSKRKGSLDLGTQTKQARSKHASHQSFKQQLGVEQWTTMRSMIGEQIKEFHRQVAELHRLKDLEERSQAGTAVRPLQSSKNQDASLGSSKPSWRNGPSSMTGPSFAPELPRFSGNTEAFSWPALHAANKARPNTQDSRKQKSEPVRILSQTTQLALDAQRMRRRLRAEKQKQSQPNQAPSIGNQISSGLDGSCRDSETHTGAQNGSDLLAQAQMQAQQNLQQLGMWNPYVQQQMLANQAMHMSQREMGKALELNERHNSAQLLANTDAIRAWAKQQQATMNGVHPANLSAQEDVATQKNGQTGGQGPSLRGQRIPQFPAADVGHLPQSAFQ